MPYKINIQSGKCDYWENDASKFILNTTNFNNNLLSSDNTVQKALNRLNDRALLTFDINLGSCLVKI